MPAPSTRTTTSPCARLTASHWARRPRPSSRCAGWTSWEPLGGLLTSDPAVASWGDERLDVFVRGIDGTIWHKACNGGTWLDWDNHVGGYLYEGSSPAAVSWGPNDIDVFARGADSGLYHTFYLSATGLWSAWEPLGGSLSSSPAAASMQYGNLEAFVRGPGNTVWEITCTGTVWSAWGDLGGSPITGDPDAVGWGGDQLDVVARGTDGAVWHRWFDGANWLP